MVSESHEEFVELISKAEYEKDNMVNLVIKASGIKTKCEEKRKEISSLRKAKRKLSSYL